MQLLFDLRVQERGGRLFDERLVAPLPGAVARGVNGELAVRVAPALRFHMAAMVDAPLHEGSFVVFEDMALYTMVKTNTFNGMPLPSIVWRDQEGACRIIRSFGYEDFKSRLS